MGLCSALDNAPGLDPGQEHMGFMGERARPTGMHEVTSVKGSSWDLGDEIVSSWPLSSGHGGEAGWPESLPFLVGIALRTEVGLLWVEGRSINEVSFEELNELGAVE